MATTTFTCFETLPAELRLMVWEFAVRPLDEGYGGIHTFSVMNADLDVEPREVEQLRPLRSTQSPRKGLQLCMTKDQNNRSAYLWDAGMLAACSESQSVVLGRTGFKLGYWTDNRNRIGDNFDDYVSLSGVPAWNQLETAAAQPSLKDDGEDWQLVTRPYVDGFKLDLSKTRQPPETGISSAMVFRNLGFPSSWRDRCGPVRNIILEWDASWNLNMPDDLQDLTLECSPRGFVANLLFEMALSSENEPCFFIWIVDRSARQRAVTGQCRGKGNEVFYDMDETLMEMDPDEARYDCTRPSWFIYKMEEIGLSMLTAWSTGLGMMDLDDSDEESQDWLASKHIGILGPR